MLEDELLEDDLLLDELLEVVEDLAVEPPPVVVTPFELVTDVPALPRKKAFPNLDKLM